MDCITAFTQEAQLNHRLFSEIALSNFDDILS